MMGATKMETVVSTDPVPGGSSIQSIISLSNMNASGDIAFVANLSGSTTVLARESQGRLTLLARTGDPAPLGGTFSSFTPPVVNGRGDVAVVTGGPSLVSEGYVEQFGGPYKNMEKDTGSLIVYALE